jgi:ABC-type nitrate/sulfonate/bicarbonate transport system ATPase subunit
VLYILQPFIVVAINSAAYARADISILDDPLSALDSHTGMCRLTYNDDALFLIDLLTHQSMND